MNVRRTTLPVGLRGSLAALIAVIAFAGCATVSASNDPTASPSSAPTATASLWPTSIGTNCTVVLPETAPAVGAVSFSGLRGGQWAQVNPSQVTRIGDSRNLIEPSSDPGIWPSGVVAGGAAIDLAFAIDNVDPQPSFSLTKVKAMYRAPGETLLRPMAATVRGNDISIALLDGSGMAELDLELTWRNACFEVVGSTRIGLAVVAAAVIAACPAGSAGIEDIIRRHADDRLLIDGATQSIGFLDVQSRYGGYAAGTDVAQFGSWDPASAPAIGTVSAAVSVAPDDPELKLVGGHASFYSRRDVESPPPAGTTPASAINLVADPSGVLALILPSSPGQFVLEVTTSWQLPCIEGDSLAYFNVETH